MGRIPDRWLEYTRINKPVDGVPVIAFKTPMASCHHRPLKSDPASQYIEQNEEFTPNDLCEYVYRHGCDFAAIIDLTNTFRYYNGSKEFRLHNIQYEKLKCEGRVLPNENIVQRFSDILSDIIFRHGFNSTRLLGVHCTHGLNRTGYLICRYLIEYLGHTPKRAIEMFEESRGYAIERQIYLDDLNKRKPSMLLQEWVRSCMDGEHPVHQHDREISRKQRKRYSRKRYYKQQDEIHQHEDGYRCAEERVSRSEIDDSL